MAEPNDPKPQKKTHSVSFRSESEASSHSVRESATKARMREELERLQRQQDEKEQLYKLEKQRLITEMKAEMQQARSRKGIQMQPDVDFNKGQIQSVLSHEERFALEDEKEELDAESERLQEEIDDKYGFSEKRDSTGLVAMAKDFYSNAGSNQGLPDRIIRELTSEEIHDLKLVFDMFDVKGRGYIIADDVGRLARMLGLKGKKRLFEEMIAELSEEKEGRVTFINFLEFVVKSQGGGSDPFDEILQAFKLLDVNNKGYLSFEDLRNASDEADLSLSNRMIREMVQEADQRGDGKITLQDFTNIMLQTSRFRAV